jgi:hypothetical protein
MIVRGTDLIGLANVGDQYCEPWALHNAKTVEHEPCGCRKSCHAHLSWDSCSQAVSVNQQQGQAGLRHDQFS